MERYNVAAAMAVDYAIERATSAALRALVHSVGEEVAKQVWEIGYLKGFNTACQIAVEMHGDRA